MVAEQGEVKVWMDRVASEIGAEGGLEEQYHTSRLEHQYGIGLLIVGYC